MLKPLNTKYAKSQKGSIPLTIKSDSFFRGNWALISLSSSRLKSSHISAALMAIKRSIKKDGKIYTRVFPHTPVSKKPLEIRMGKGKGSIDHWITHVHRGSFIFEISSILPLKTYQALTLAQSKLPFPSQIIQKS